MRVLSAMLGPNAGAEAQLLWNAGLPAARGLLWCLALGAIALYAPNSNRVGELLQRRMSWAAVVRPLLAGASIAALLFMLLVNVARDSVSAFIYFNF